MVSVFPALEHSAFAVENTCSDLFAGCSYLVGHHEDVFGCECSNQATEGVTAYWLASTVHLVYACMDKQN